MCEKNYIWDPWTCTYKNGNYLENIISELVITSDRIIERTKTILTNFNKKS